MSILIKGMEMPRNCDDCRLDIDCAYDESQDGYKMMGGRPRKCPLVPVPPHGRLIDGDKLAEEQKENVRAYHANLITLDDLAECLLKQSISEDGAPTIIPAEEENK